LRQRNELANALEDMLFVGEHKDSRLGFTVEQLFHIRFSAARAALAIVKEGQ
jgi:hypothetical protein